MSMQEYFAATWSTVGAAIETDLGEQVAAHAATISEEIAKAAEAAEARRKEQALKDSGKAKASSGSATAPPPRDSNELIAARAAKFNLEQSIEEWRTVEWQDAERSYRSRLQEHVSTTRLLGHPKPVRIDQLFTDVFVLEQMSAFSRTDLRLADPGNDPYTFHQPHERRNALDLVGSGEHIYVLGHPGAGKTTFLKYVTILACKAKIERTPVYIPLRDVAQLRIGVREYMHREFDICGLPAAKQFCETLLKEVNTLLLIDGLDELQDSSELRKSIILEITELARRYPNAQLVLTCRIAASDYAFEQFTYCEVAQFTIEQQKSFIRKWYSAEEDRRSTLLASWDSRRVAPLRDLAKTPLLLALICLAFDELGEIPERRTDLYRDAIETLLKRWDSTRSIRRDPFYGGLNSMRREQLLQELAWQFHAQNKILFAPEVAAPIVKAWFAKLPDPPTHESEGTEELLDQIEAQHGLIVQRAAGIYSFSHLSLQEFFTARSIAQGHPQNTVDRMVKMHFAEPRWREVFVFLAGLLPDGSGLLERLRAEAATSGARAPEVHRFIGHVMTEFVRQEPEWRRERTTDAEAVVRYSGKAPVLVALSALEGRVDELKWLGPRSGLRLKIMIARVVLEEIEDQKKHLLSESLNSDRLVAYFHAANLAVDCASVAVCENRERAVAWILTPLQS